MKFTFVLALFLWWPWHHHKPKPTPPPNYFCDPDYNSDDGEYIVILCAPISDCSNPYDTDGQRCLVII